jgi:hypothetical protein
MMGGMLRRSPSIRCDLGPIDGPARAAGSRVGGRAPRDAPRRTVSAVQYRVLTTDTLDFTSNDA